jgi:PAS domain S-box-containing protein
MVLKILRGDRSMSSPKTASADHGGNSAVVAQTTPGKPPAWSLEYFRNPTTVLGVLLALAAGPACAYFYGPMLAVLWTVPAIVGLLVVVTFSIRANMGEKAAEAPAAVVQAVLVAHWMALATALWFTGHPGAWIVAITIPASWAIHIIFAGQRNLRVTLGMLAICALPMLGFMLYATWTMFPLWVSIPGTFSALAMVASIASSAEYANRNFVNLQKSVAEVKVTKERLQFAIESAGDGYMEMNLETDELVPMASLARSTGYEPRKLSIEEGLRMVHAEDRAEARNRLARIKAGEFDGWDQEVRMRMGDGSYRWMRLRMRQLREDGKPTPMVVATMVDLSHAKAQEADLRAAKDTAETSSRIKSQFLANMSHEIRTPLNGVLGMAQALAAEELPPSQKEKVNIILDSGKSLMALLNDVLDLSKIEAGKLEISPVPGDFLHTMKRTRQLFQAQAEDKGLELFVRYDSNFPQRLTYDPVRVRQCVSNLLSNAIKFTVQGRVEVAISAKALGGGDHMVALEVVDTGIGMNRETVDKLFEVFTQADGATTRKFGGSGLGLAISRQLARMMGGDLTVESEEGRGSTFRLTFKAAEAAPAARSAHEARIEPVRKSLMGMRVLLTDDNAINRQVIKLFLAPQGCDVVEATNGKEALDKIATAEFDLVLLDVHMPVMDGKEAIQRLRANPKWAQLPVIALTADAMSGDRERYLALGMTDYVSKPVDQRELVARMYAVMRLEAPPQAQARTGS